MKIVEVKDFTPKCPHCEERLTEVYRISDVKGFLQGQLGYCYACPSCEKVLGFADYGG